MKRSSRGASKLEFILVVLVVAGLIGFASNRLEGMLEHVERLSFEGEQSRVQAQLRLKVAEWYTDNTVISRKQFRKRNPLTLIRSNPDKYNGEVLLSDLPELPAERWYYIKDKNWLAYKAKRTSQLENNFEQADIVAFRVEPGFAQPDVEQGSVLSLELKSVYQYSWRTD